MAPVLTLEFTIEPFVAGHPGPHVLEAVAAAEALGASVEFGPFGSTCVVPAARAGEISRAVIDTAFAHGATFVALSATRLSDDLLDLPGPSDEPMGVPPDEGRA